MRTHPTPRPRRLLAAGLTCLAAAALVPLGGLSDPADASGAGTAPTVTVRPTALERGPAPAIPHLVGTTVVDGRVRIPLDAEDVTLVGEVTPGQYVVTTSSEEDGFRVLRVSADADPVVLARRFVDTARVLKEEPEQIVTSVYRSGRPGRPASTQVQVRSTEDGAVVASHVFPGGALLLDAVGDEIVLGGYDRPLRVWDPATDGVRTLSGGRGTYAADLTVDRIARFTGDPYDGGCTEVALFSAPSEVVWRSCTDAVMAWSPDGRRMLTDHKLTDGLGPNRITERRGSGQPIARYEADRYFGFPTWEDGRHWIADASGPRRQAQVRCGGGDCERVGPVRRTDPL